MRQSALAEGKAGSGQSYGNNLIVSATHLEQYMGTTRSPLPQNNGN